MIVGLIVALHVIPIAVVVLFVTGVFHFDRTVAPASTDKPAEVAVTKIAASHPQPLARSPEPPPKLAPPVAKIPAPAVIAPHSGATTTPVPPATPAPPAPVRRSHLPKWSVAGSRILRSLAVAANGRAVTGELDRTVRVWEPNGVESHTFPASVGPNCNVTISHDGNTILIGGNDPMRLGRIFVDSDCLVRTVSLKTHKTSIVGIQPTVVYCLALSPNGRFALSGTERQLRYWDVLSGRDLRPAGYVGHTGVPRSVDIHPKLPQAVSVANDLTIRIWDLKKGEMLRVITGVNGDPDRISYSPDGQAILVSGWGSFGVWDAATGAPVLTPTGVAGVVGVARAACWSPDGRIVIGGPGG
ncbi:MAG TPA: hypothetical protein VH120_04685, partial [Gemmataceae bacterium]|nr:hypothetical protein [Gemmataceae bacterium]